MNAPTRSAIRMVALFPHEDAARPLRLYRGRLFAAGYAGARSFPLCAPLAILARPLKRVELGKIAAEIRSAAALTDERGRIAVDSRSALGEDDSTLPPHLGLPLSIPAPLSLPDDAILTVCAHPRLVLAVLEAYSAPLPALPDMDGPAVFRAAYIANVVLEPAGNGDPRFSFTWEIGQPQWLPGYER